MPDFADRYVLGDSGWPWRLSAGRYSGICLLDRQSGKVRSVMLQWPTALGAPNCPPYRLVLERVDAPICENCGVVLDLFWGRCPKCGGFYRTGVRDEQGKENDG